MLSPEKEPERKGCIGSIGSVIGHTQFFVDRARGYAGKARELGPQELVYRASLDHLSLAQYQRFREIIVARLNIESEEIPESLGEGKRAILVFNYPSVRLATDAVLDVLCRLPGKELRGKAIARKKILRNPVLRALGARQLVLPAEQSKKGYTLSGASWKEIFAFLEEEDSVLGMSVTGNTRGNGLLMGDIRTGVAQISDKKGVAVVPLGIITEGEGREMRIVKTRFGATIQPLDLGVFEKIEHPDRLIDFSKLVMCAIAELLPPDQRGDFENPEAILMELPEAIRRRKSLK